MRHGRERSRTETTRPGQSPEPRPDPTNSSDHVPRAMVGRRRRVAAARRPLRGRVGLPNSTGSGTRRTSRPDRSGTASFGSICVPSGVETRGPGRAAPQAVAPSPCARTWHCGGTRQASSRIRVTPMSGSGSAPARARVGIRRGTGSPRVVTRRRYPSARCSPPLPPATPRCPTPASPTTSATRAVSQHAASSTIAASGASRTRSSSSSSPSSRKPASSSSPTGSCAGSTTSARSSGRSRARTSMPTAGRATTGSRSGSGRSTSTRSGSSSPCRTSRSASTCSGRSRSDEPAIPGPMTRDRLTMTLAEAIAREIRALAAAGCTVVQIDEPAAVEIETEADRALFRAAHRRLTHAVEGVHLMLSVLPGNADRAGAGRSSMRPTTATSSTFATEPTTGCSSRRHRRSAA